MAHPLKEVPSCLQSPESYTRLRRRLIRYFAGHGCPDASGLADEVVTRVLEAVHKRDEDIRDITKFAYGIARNMRVDIVRSNARREPPPETIHSFPTSRPNPRAMCLERCLRRLPSEKRELIEAYFIDRRRAELARTLRISISALRTKICNLKRELAQCVETCVQSNHRK